jgi:hypothetical protein
MNKTDETLKLAMEALNTTESDCGSRAWEREQEAITAIKQALAAPVQEPEHLQQGVDALVSAAGTALEVLEKHRQIKGEAPMGMLGVRAIEELKEAFGLLHPQDDCEPPAQPATEKYTALEQALTRLQKRYAELEAKIAAQRQWVGLPDEDAHLLAHPRLARAAIAKATRSET